MLTKIKILAISSDTELKDFLEKELSQGKYEIVCTRDTGITLREKVEKDQPHFITRQSLSKIDLIKKI